MVGACGRDLLILGGVVWCEELIASGMYRGDQLGVFAEDICTGARVQKPGACNDVRV